MTCLKTPESICHWADPAPCDNCLPAIREELQKFSEDIATSEPVDSFSVHLDSIGVKPELIISIHGTDKQFPLLTDPDKNPSAAIQEMMLKFMGAAYCALKANPEFIQTCSKLGIKFNVE